MTLKDRFSLITPREKSGASTSDKYDYQKHWSLMTLLEHHLSGSDYLFVFEYHDDMVIFDAEENPQKVSFYQVKTKDTGKNWKISDLISSKQVNKVTKKPMLSIFGKLYHNKINYPGDTSSLNFVSNAKFEVDLADGSTSTGKNSICISDLDGKVIDNISKTLVKEHSLQSDPDFKAITFLKVSGLSIDDHAGHVKGKLSEFVEQLLPGKKYIAGAVYKSLYGEIQRKTNYNKDLDSFPEIVKHKSIGKKCFEGLIAQIGLTENYDELWTSIENRLNSEQAPVGLIKNLKSNWSKYEMDRMNKTNTTLNKICSEIKRIITTFGADEIKSLVQFLADVEAIYKKDNTGFSVYNDYYIKAVILATYYES